MPVSFTPAKVAIPPDAAWVVPPASVSELEVMTMSWLDWAPVETRLLSWSRISTTGWVVKAWPYLAVAALVVSTSLVAAPTPTLKLLDVWDVYPVAANVSV